MAQDDERLGRDDITPSVPWDDSDITPAEPTLAPDVTEVVPTAHDGETRAFPAGDWQRPEPPASPPAGTPPGAPPSQTSPWRQAAPPPNPWATQQPAGTPPPGGPVVPPGGIVPPPGGPMPYGAPWGAPPPKKSRALLWVVLGVVGAVVLAIVGVVLAVVLMRGPDVNSLYADCEAGNALACEELYQVSDIGSEEEEFGLTCGGRTDGTVDCTEADMDAPAHSWTGPDDGTTDDGTTDDGGDDGVDGDEVFTYGDDAFLDGLWDACASGDMIACDDLYMESPVDSDYERFADTCGDTTSGGTWCEPGRED